MTLFGVPGKGLDLYHDIGPDGQAARFSYHPSGGGLWIELVHTSFKSELSGWIADTLRELGEDS